MFLKNQHCLLIYYLYSPWSHSIRNKVRAIMLSLFSLFTQRMFHTIPFSPFPTSLPPSAYLLPWLTPQAGNSSAFASHDLPAYH